MRISAVGIALAIPLWYVSSVYLLWMGHRKDLFREFLVPVITEYIGIEQEQVPWIVLVIMAVMTYTVTATIQTFAVSMDGGHDPQYPRAGRDRLTGFTARAVGAHLNFLENFPLFAVAAVVSRIANVPSSVCTELSAVYLLARLVYLPIYLSNMEVGRSFVWAAGTLACYFMLAAAAFPAEFAQFWP